MSNIWNPHAFGVTGQPTAPQTNALRVYGAEPSKEQLAMAQQAFAKFCMTERLSFAPNQTQQGFLPDGSKYRIVVVGNTRIMEVRVDGVDSESSQSGVLVTTWQSGSQYTRTLFVPGGEFAMPDGTWKAKDKNRESADDQPLWFDRPRYVGESWHSPSTTEYYVRALDDTYMARAGAYALNVGYSVGPHVVRSPVMAINIDGEKKFGVLSRTNDKAYLLYGDSVNTSAVRATPQNVTITESMEIVSAPSDAQIEALNPSPDGAKALVTTRKYNALPATSEPLPYKGQFAYSPYRYAFGDDVYMVSQYAQQVDPHDTYATEHSFDGSAWTEGAEFFRAAPGSCAPLGLYITDANGAVLHHSGGITRKTLAHPTWWVHPNINGNCNYPADEPTPRMLLRSLGGAVSGNESQVFDSGEILDGTPGNGYKGAWYSHDGEKHVVPSRQINEYSMEFTSTVDWKGYGSLWCQEHDVFGIWTESGTSKQANYESGSARVDLHRKNTASLMGREFVLYEMTASEEVEYELSHVWALDAIEAPLRQRDEVTLSTVLDVEFVVRRILEIDPQFGMVCFLEAQYQFQRGATSTHISEQEFSSAHPTSTYTGGDTASPPVPQIGHVVIEVDGVEVLRDEVISNRTDESPAIFTDCTHPWVFFHGRSMFKSPAEEFMRMKDLYGPETNVSRPFFYSLGTGGSPLSASGIGHVETDYAKDPKTGGGVLLLKSAYAGYVKAFTVDHRGITPISQASPNLVVAPHTEAAAT